MYVSDRGRRAPQHILSRPQVKVTDPRQRSHLKMEGGRSECGTGDDAFGGFINYRAAIQCGMLEVVGQVHGDLFTVGTLSKERDAREITRQPCRDVIRVWIFCIAPGNVGDGADCPLNKHNTSPHPPLPPFIDIA